MASITLEIVVLLPVSIKVTQTTSELSPDFFIPVTDVVVSDEFESVDSYKAYRSKLASPNSLSLAHLC